MNDAPNPYHAPNAPLDDPSRVKKPAPGRISLVELLVVLAILGVLIGLVSPALHS